MVSAKIRNSAIASAIVVSSLLLATLLMGLPMSRVLTLKANDRNFVIRGKIPTPHVVLVVADQKTLNTFPELEVFWHPYFADAIRGAAAGGARVIGLDVAFGVPVAQWAPNHDQLMAEAVSTSAVPVVCGYVPGLTEKQKDWPVPVNMISSALGLSGFSNLTVDPDDFVRNQELIEDPPGNSGGEQSAPMHSFSLRLAEKYLGQDAEYHNGTLKLVGQPVPMPEAHSMIINYAGPPGTFPRISLSDFVAAYRAGRVNQLQAWVKGRAVLIGPDSFEDRQATPYYGLFSGPKWTTAGVEIHASALETLLNRNYLVPMPDWAQLLMMLAAGVATTWICHSCSIGRGAFTCCVMLVGILVSAHVLFRAGFIVGIPRIVATFLFCLIGTIAYRFVTAEKGRLLFRHAISIFVGQRVARDIELSGISMAGSRQLVTILFTDIRGFTAFCDEKDPGEVVQVLNEYLHGMVAIITQHHGHVNKFIGDGILAIFSDEDGTTPGDHPVRAVECALEMVTVPGAFRTGAGIHTGMAVLGNVGSEKKMEYTALGDTVNLASRLESLNKEYKTSLLMSEATRNYIGTRIENVCLGQAPIRGKTGSVPLYTVPAAKAAFTRSAEAN